MILNWLIRVDRWLHRVTHDREADLDAAVARHPAGKGRRGS